MGKQPATYPVFAWRRIRPGAYRARVDGIEYGILRTARRRWELTGSAPVGGVLVRLYWTQATAARHLRAQARRSHSTTVAAAAARASEGPDMSAIISDSITAALELRLASLELTHEEDGWYAQFNARPNRQWIRISARRPDPAAAMAELGTLVRTEMQAGGKLVAPLAALGVDR